VISKNKIKVYRQVSYAILGQLLACCFEVWFQQDAYKLQNKLSQAGWDGLLEVEPELRLIFAKVLFVSLFPTLRLFV
jgi:hypothetical protein